jgi:DNA-binding NarL/FixJ family response regulator
MRAGARGYVLEGANYREMLRAMRAVGEEEEAIFIPAVAVRLADYFANSIRPSAPPDAFPELSERECEILALLARGLKNPEIAARPYLSPKTVRNNVSNILTKLQVADRAQAVIRAREAGLG